MNAMNVIFHKVVPYRETMMGDTERDKWIGTIDVPLDEATGEVIVDFADGPIERYDVEDLHVPCEDCDGVVYIDNTIGHVACVECGFVFG